jgi:AcrR family transcriptional regulator
MMKRDEKKAANRQKIVDAAYDLMLTNGFQKTSVREVSQASGISLVTMYKYFKNKDELVHAVILKMLAQGIGHSKRVFENDDLDFMEKFRVYTADYAKERAKVSESVLKEVSEITRDSPDIQAKIHQWRDAFGRQLIVYGRKSGAIQTTVSDQAIEFFANMFTEYIVSSIPEQANDEIIVQLEELFLYGLAGKQQK